MADEEVDRSSMDSSTISLVDPTDEGNVESVGTTDDGERVVVEKADEEVDRSSWDSSTISLVDPSNESNIESVGTTDDGERVVVEKADEEVDRSSWDSSTISLVDPPDESNVESVGTTDDGERVVVEKWEYVPDKMHNARCTFMSKIILRYMTHLVSALHEHNVLDTGRLCLDSDLTDYIQIHNDRRKQVRGIMYAVMNELNYWTIDLFANIMEILRDLDPNAYKLLKERFEAFSGYYFDDLVRSDVSSEDGENQSPTIMHADLIETFETAQTNLGAKLKFDEIIKRIEPSLLDGTIFEFERRPGRSLVKLVLSKLKQGSIELYDSFMTALKNSDLDLFKSVKDDCRIGQWQLKEYGPNIIEYVDVKEIMYLIKEYLSEDERNQLESIEDKGERTLCLIGMMSHRLELRCSQLYDQFMMAMAGLEPGLYRTLTQRSPTDEEVECCVQTHISKVKDLIKQKGHHPDKEGDRKIDLTKNYVRLRLIKAAKDKTHMMENDANDITSVKVVAGSDSQLPSDYQASLTTSDIDIEDVAEKLSSYQKKCLIQGRCGIGKTTMLQHLTLRWADGQCLKKFTFVFLIHIRMLTVIDCKLSLYQLLTHYSLYPIDVPLKWLMNWPDKILVMVDGLDEIGNFSHQIQNVRDIEDIMEEASPIEICVNILRFKLLPKSTLISTSRAFEGLTKLPRDETLEVMGLTQDGVLDYVRKNVESSRTNKVISTLQENPVLMSVCSITYYASVLCTVLAMDVSKSAKDIETYSRLTAFIIQAYPLRQYREMSQRLNCSRCFPGLSEIAYNGVFSSGEEANGVTKISFNMEDLIRIRSDEIAPSIKTAQENGLVQVTEVEIEGINRQILEFPHLSVQEFFAALQFLKVSDNELTTKQQLMKVRTDGRLNMLQLFVFGAAFDTKSQEIMHMKLPIADSNSLSEASENEFKKHLKKLASEAESNHQILQVAQIAYEGQNQSLISIVSGHLTKNDTMVMRDIPLNALDFKALGFVLSASPNLTKVTMDNVNLDCYSVGILMKSLQGSMFLESLNLSNNKQIKSSGLKAVSDLLKNIPRLVDLSLSGNAITSEMLENLRPGFSQARDRFSLSLGNNSLKDEGAKAVVSMLSSVDSIIALDLSFNRLSPEGVQILCSLGQKMNNIELLALDGNDVTDEDLDQLINALPDKAPLSSLSLNDTQITDVGATTISQMIPRMQSLEYIGLNRCQIGTSGAQQMIKGCKESNLELRSDLSHNQINQSKLDDHGNITMEDNTQWHSRIEVVCQHINSGKNFKTLNLSGVQLDEHCIMTLGQALMNNSHIKEIILTDNDELDDDCIEFLHPLVFTCQNLQKIDLRGTGVTETVQKEYFDMSLRLKTAKLVSSDRNGPLTYGGLVALSHFLIQEGMSMHTLKLKSCKVADAGAQSLGSALANNASISYLDLSENEITDQAISSFIPTLSSSATLTDLDLADNNVGTSGARQIFTALKQNTALKTLKIDRNGIGDECGETIRQVLETNTTLSHLSISGNEIKQAGAYEIGAGLRVNESLLSMNLANNKIEGKSSSDTFCSSLVSNTTLKSLNLAYTRVNNDDAKEIGIALETSISLTHLNLSHNLISDTGGVLIAEGLANNKSLQSLNLRGNRIKVEGPDAFGHALATNNTLTELVLDENYMGDVAAEALCRGLLQNSTLTTLSLNYNQVGDLTAKTIAEAFATNKTIQTINLDNNVMSSDGVEPLCKSLLENKRLSMIAALVGKSDNYVWDDSKMQVATFLVQNGIVPLIELPEWKVEKIIECITKIL